MKYICTNAYLKFHHANWCIHAWYNVALVACCTLIAKISSRCARAEVFAKARVCVCVHVCGWLGALHFIYIYTIYIYCTYTHTYVETLRLRQFVTLTSSFIGASQSAFALTQFDVYFAFFPFL